MISSTITNAGIAVVVEICEFGYPNVSLSRTTVEALINRIQQQEAEFEVLTLHYAEEKGLSYPFNADLPCENRTVTCYLEWAENGEHQKKCQYKTGILL